MAFTRCGTDGARADYDAVIIGSGGGGLAAAARLAIAGKKVAVIEQHYQPGGYMSSFRRGDYTFEVSLHAMDGIDPDKGINVQMLKDLRIYDKIKPIRLDPMYRISYPGLTMDIPADALEYKNELIKRFPHEKQGIENLFATMDRIETALSVGMEFLRGNYLKGIWGVFTNPLAFYTLMKYNDASAARLINDFLKDKSLINVFATLIGFLGEGTDEISALIYAAMWNSYHKGGYYYFEGGSQSVTDALVKVIKENNGEIFLSTRAVKIIIENGRAVAVKAEDVRTKETKEYRCSYVVSNANAPDTFFKLVGEENLPADYVERLKSMSIGPSTFVVYMGVKKDYTKYYPEHVHGIMVSDFSDEADNVKAVKEGDVSRLSFGIANYTVLNPDSAPKGKNTICMVCVMPWNVHDEWKLKEGYDKYTALKKEMAMKLVKRAERLLPGLASNIEVMEVGTPVTNRNYTSNPNGTIFGWANSPEQSMMNRLPNNTPIKNLFLAGAWTLPCGGQSAVMISGNMAAGMILND